MTGSESWPTNSNLPTLAAPGIMKEDILRRLPGCTMPRKIVHYPHPALRHKSKPVMTIDKELHLQIGEMKDLMYQAKGLGLAAPQVALPFQLLVTNITGDPAKKECEEVFLNPQIVER